MPSPHMAHLAMPATVPLMPFASHAYNAHYHTVAMVKQFLQDVVWGDLDYLVIDTPPGMRMAWPSILVLVLTHPWHEDRMAEYSSPVIDTHPGTRISLPSSPFDALSRRCRF